jgi:hypothetical protein
MSPIRATEKTRFNSELNQLNQFSQFLSEIAAVVVAGNDDFENIWNIANRVYDRHCSGESSAENLSDRNYSGQNYMGQNYLNKVSVISRSAKDRSPRAALSA